MSYHKTIINGRIGKEVELRYTETGKAVASFSVAVSEGSKDKQITTWYRCTAWEKTGEFVNQHFGKGSAIICEGKMQCETYEKDGIKRDSWKLVVREVSFPDGNSKRDSEGGDGGGGHQQQPQTQQRQQQPAQSYAGAGARSAPAQQYQDDVGLDDIPF